MSQIKSKKRVADHGEVFTAEREVKAMCDLVANDCSNIFSRFLEPACGDGNFLAEILTRKLAVVKEKYRRNSYDWERYSLLAIGSLYGVDILADNCVSCRERLFGIWNAEYKKVCKKECNEDTRAAARFILNRNIVCGNALTYRCVTDSGEETGEPIVFAEWSFPRNDAFIHRKDYSFDETVNGPQKAPGNQDAQLGLFEADDAPSTEGKFIQEYKCHYRRLGDNDAA